MKNAKAMKDAQVPEGLWAREAGSSQGNIRDKLHAQKLSVATAKDISISLRESGNFGRASERNRACFG